MNRSSKIASMGVVSFLRSKRFRRQRDRCLYDVFLFRFKKF